MDYIHLLRENAIKVYQKETPEKNLGSSKYSHKLLRQ